MEPVIVVGGARVFSGDCIEVLKGLPENSVDSIVTDPPYGLEFMGKDWDAPWKKSGDVIDDPASVGGFQDGAGGNPFSRSRIRYGRDNGAMVGFQLWATEWAVECLRVLKPGGHILAFGGSRTWHRLAVAVEDAGFELRDSIAWIYGSGFPKSLDVSKAIDKKAGVEREVTGSKIGLPGYSLTDGKGGLYGGGFGANGTGDGECKITSPATSEAKTWEGWGTALKPAFEPVVVGRKPFGKGVTVAENVLEWGVGGLNIDGSRIAGGERPLILSKNENSNNAFGDGLNGSKHGGTFTQGRWPANVILDEVTAGLLDEQSGVSKSTPFESDGVKRVSGSRSGGGMASGGSAHTDSGGASRFFYVAKASRRDRNEGLEELEAVRHANRVVDDGPGGENPRNRTNQAKQNFHPTVKPTALMRYLIKLVTPEGGVVLDPFTGSGSTGKAALLDGFQFVGVELTEEYLPIIEGRLRWASEQVEDDGTLF
jgi:DNA modification methylase